MAPLLFHGRVSRASPRVGVPGSAIRGGQLRRRSGLRADPGQRQGIGEAHTLPRCTARGRAPVEYDAIVSARPKFADARASIVVGSAPRSVGWTTRSVELLRAGARVQARAPRARTGARCARCTERCAKRGPMRGPVGEPRRIVSERRSRARTETETERSQLESRPCKACNGSARGVLSSPRSSPKPR